MFGYFAQIPMRQFLYVTLFSFFICQRCGAQVAPIKFDRAAFYKVMASGDLNQIDSELIVVQQSGADGSKGYEGALLMRKAGLLKKAKEKLKFFKEGRIKMETQLLADSTNTELRFLRLTIEEHAPKIVKYRADLSRDKRFVIEHYENLLPVVKEAVVSYSKNSNILKPGDFNGYR
jgi:hypothetical protein